MFYKYSRVYLPEMNKNVDTSRLLLLVSKIQIVASGWTVLITCLYW